MFCWDVPAINHKGICHAAQIRLVIIVDFIVEYFSIRSGNNTPLQPTSSNPPPTILIHIKMKIKYTLF